MITVAVERTPDQLRDDLDSLRAQQVEVLRIVEQRCDDLGAQKDAAYRERNLVLALLTRLCRASPIAYAYRARHPESDREWEDDRRWIVFIVVYDTFDAKKRQFSWHIHDSELPLFAGLPVLENDWDGHTTEEKYDRIRRLVGDR